MGRVFVQYLDSGVVYQCSCCGTHLTTTHDLLSRQFHCKNGKAYLFDRVVNVRCGNTEDRQMTTGWHVVADIYCCSCGVNVGWKYLEAEKPDQQYKIGKMILERKRLEKRNAVNQEPTQCLVSHQISVMHPSAPPLSAR
eukprot:TRINITY_DN1665_c0_g2_i1.p5 TRINITY_DN1665_c0_g2~~TRINITY_DN1665_c0_g2_i1.p5  ORF type:complete len:139 (-),score=3.70 TRINITY_DN1665_c0_g2_i1:697-1113(-)